MSNPFLAAAYRTLSFRIQVTVNDDDTWSYEEDAVMQLPDRPEQFHHIDHNTLTRVAEASPNPLAQPIETDGGFTAEGGLGIGSLRGVSSQL